MNHTPEESTPRDVAPQAPGRPPQAPWVQQVGDARVGGHRRAFLLTAAVVVLLDVATKLVVFRTLHLNGGPIPVLGDWVRLTYIHNPGAAFGLFQGNRWFFVAVSVLSVAILLTLSLSGRYRDRWIQASFGLILGGALGNLIDRLWLGVVIDFIDLGMGFHRWPVFNVADIGVTLGVFVLAARLLIFEERARQEPGEPDTGSGSETPSGGASPESPPRGT